MCVCMDVCKATQCPKQNTICNQELVDSKEVRPIQMYVNVDVVYGMCYDIPYINLQLSMYFE